MAGNIKGITIEIGGDTQKLNKALEDVNKKSRDIQSELKQVEKLLKLNPKDTEMLAQQQKLLAEAVENSKEKLDRLKTAQEQVNEQFRKGEISEEQYRAFQREVVKAEQELAGFEKQLKSTSEASKTLGEKMQAAGEKIKDVGGNMTKYVTVPLAAAGAGITALGVQFDDAFDKIRIGTGATGKALEALNDDFRAVAKQVPSNFDEVSTAIADYNTRLGISGEALQDLSVQTLNLARITEADLGKTIEEVSQAFQAFNVPVIEYGDALDYVFKVSQSTGIATDRLLSNMVKFSPALKQMGFDFQESAALMGFFDKAGVEVEQAMVGLNKALVTMAKKGVTDANEALQKLFDEIKNAPSDLAATELAIETFGAKAGPALASAIREGKIEFQALVEELTNSEETINSATKATDDWAEGLAKLKNQIFLAMEPISSVMFETLNELVAKIADDVTPALERLGEAFANLPQGVQVAILAIAGLLALIGPLLQGLGAIVIAAPGIAAAFGFISTAVTFLSGLLSTLAGVILPALAAAAAALGVPIWAVVAAIAAVVAIVVLLIKYWDEIIAGFRTFGQVVVEVVEKVVSWLKEKWAKIVEYVTEQYEKFIETWQERLDFVKKMFTGFKDKIVEVFTVLKDTVFGIWEKLWGGIFGIFERGIKMLLTGTFYLVDWMLDRWNAFKEGLLDIWGGIVGFIYEFVNVIIGLVNKIIGALNKIQVEIPEWVPEWGGKTWGIDIKPIKKLDKEKDMLTADQVREQEKKELEISGKVTFEGVNNEGDLVAAVDAIWDQLMNKFALEVRR